MTEQTGEGPVRQQLALLPIRVSGRLTAGTLLLAAVAWAVQGVWEVRLAAAGEPASGPPVQEGGVHRPLTALEDSYHLVTSVAQGVVALCAFFFLAWVWRVRDNARIVSGEPPRYGGVWVYLGWILPIANLWIPRGIVADAYRSTVPGRKLPVSVNVWWAFWLLAGTTRGLGLLRDGSTDAAIARAYSEIVPLLCSDAAVIGAAVAGAFAVRAVTAVQTERIAVGRCPAPADAEGPDAVRVPAGGS
ncbi:DUF4328 domain-containing protein [Streptomyces sp. NPDC005573]|uniref:DUF4328 domain-containing protein n=1 Tax=Streptomyces sp. NPDC005573 TaxID=3156890 RepID=UPI0033A3B40A